MSDTPKTDSIEVWSDNVGMGILVVPAREMRQVEKQLAEARAEIEKFNNLFKNGIDCFMSPCERHSGENTPPFDEFIKKYGHKCTPCLVEELATAIAELRELKKKMGETPKNNKYGENKNGIN